MTVSNKDLIYRLFTDTLEVESYFTNLPENRYLTFFKHILKPQTINSLYNKEDGMELY